MPGPSTSTIPRPRIAIVIVGLGPLHGATSAAINQLPAEVTLSFDPYDQALPEWIGAAHAIGHEVMLDLPTGDEVPMATGGSVPMTISLDGKAKPAQSADLQRLDWVAGRAGGYIGLAASNSALAGSAAERGSVLQDMGRRGPAAPRYQPGRCRPPRHLGLRPAAGHRRSRSSTSGPTAVSVDAQLAALEARARQTGFAVGIAKGYPVTIERLALWSRGLQEKNLALAPVSALVGQQAAPMIPYEKRPYRPGVGIMLLDAIGPRAGRPAPRHALGRLADAPGRHRQGREAARGRPARDARGDRHRQGRCSRRRAAAGITTICRRTWRTRSGRGAFAASARNGSPSASRAGTSDIDIATEHPEFSPWKWAEMAELPDLIVPFKRQLYRTLVEEFGHLAKKA